MKAMIRVFAIITMVLVVVVGCGDEDADGPPAGDLMLEVTGMTAALVSGGQSEFVNATFTGQIKGAAGGPGLKSFSSPRSFEVTRTTVKPTPVVNKIGLAAGSWEFKVRVKSWSGSCTTTVKSDAVITVLMPYNKQGCTTK